jgi:hypothetical protein
MHLDTVVLFTSWGERRASLDNDGEVRFSLGRSQPPWVLATVQGAHATPWGDEPAWAVSAPLWLGSP